MKRKQWVMAVAVGAVLALSGCSSPSSSHTSAPSPTPYTQTQETAYMKTFNTLTGKTTTTPSAIVTQLNANVARVNQADASTMVDSLLYVMQNQSSSLNTEIQGFQKQLAQAQQQGINLNDPSSFTSESDATIKSFLTDVHNKHFAIANFGSLYVAEPDLQWVMDTYGKYMAPDLKALVNFSLQENKQPFYNNSSNSFDLNLMAGRIVQIENMMKEYPKSQFKSGMQNIHDYYYQAYFGANNSLLVDKNQVVLPAVITAYKDAIKKYPKSQLAKDLTTYLGKLKATKDKVTPNISVWVIKLTNLPTQNTQSSGTATTTSPTTAKSTASTATSSTKK